VFDSKQIILEFPSPTPQQQKNLEGKEGREEEEENRKKKSSIVIFVSFQ
jgi:hypothetical protein